MTLEEFGDLQRQEALERQAREAGGEGTEGQVRRYAQLQADGDEDHDELVDQVRCVHRSVDLLIKL